MKNAFITGSRAYGVPHEKSDTDLVILVDDFTAMTLMNSCDEPKSWEDYEGIDDGKGLTVAIRFGVLNLIIHTSKDKFKAWKFGTEELMKRDSVTRDEAVECIKNYLAQSEALTPQ